MEITSIDDLRAAQRANRWLDRPEVDAIVLNLPLEHQQKTFLASKIKRLFNDCGCLWGAPGMLFGILLYLIPAYNASGFSLVMIVYALGVGVVAAIVSKYIALLVSHLRLKQVLINLENTINQDLTQHDAIKLHH